MSKKKKMILWAIVCIFLLTYILWQIRPVRLSSLISDTATLEVSRLTGLPGQTPNHKLEEFGQLSPQQTIAVKELLSQYKYQWNWSTFFNHKKIDHAHIVVYIGITEPSGQLTAVGITDLSEIILHQRVYRVDNTPELLAKLDKILAPQGTS